MHLPAVVHTFGKSMHHLYGEHVHKVAINAGFTCPNRDGSKGRGGCTFCNNRTFSPNAKQPPPIAVQLHAGKSVIRKRTGARKFIAYFQAYTNTYDDISVLRQRYAQALEDRDVIGISIGTRPDCVPDDVLDLLEAYQHQGKEVWLELGLQSAFDDCLQRVRRGHTFADYVDALQRSRSRGLKVCTHLIVGLPGESAARSLSSLDKVITLGCDGLKLHPLHVVKGTRLAVAWRRGEYRALDFEEYVSLAAEMIRRTPSDVIYHRLTATAEKKFLLAPDWCAHKWRVLNAIHDRLCEQHAGQAHNLNEERICGTGLSGR